VVVVVVVVHKMLHGVNLVGIVNVVDKSGVIWSEESGVLSVTV
jgi:hypothetical protein